MRYTEHQFSQMEREAAEAADIRRQCRDEYLASLDPRKPHSLANSIGSAIGTLNALRVHLDKDGYPATAASCRLAADELLTAWTAHVKGKA
jgi:hypothetical protein